MALPTFGQSLPLRRLCCSWCWPERSPQRWYTEVGETQNVSPPAQRPRTCSHT